jgi:hypothetical protein
MLAFVNGSEIILAPGVNMPRKSSIFFCLKFSLILLFCVINFLLDKYEIQVLKNKIINLRLVAFVQ